MDVYVGIAPVLEDTVILSGDFSHDKLQIKLKLAITAKLSPEGSAVEENIDSKTKVVNKKRFSREI